MEISIPAELPDHFGKAELIGKSMPQEQFDGKTDIVLDTDLSVEKLLQLIQHGAEEDVLDYKRLYDLSSQRHKVDIVCDLVAMANTNGGYIVLGVDETIEGGRQFTSVGLDNEILKDLDVTKIADQVATYVMARLNIFLQIHHLAEMDGKTFALLYVSQGDDLPIIFTKDGQFEHNGRSKTKFRSGEIFVRRGAASVRADQNDMRRIISLIRRREKEKWIEDLLGMADFKKRADAVLEIVSGNESAYIQRFQGPSFDETMYYVDDATFEKHIVDLLEAGKTVSLSRYLKEAWPIFADHVRGIVSSEDGQLQRVRDNKLLPILDSLAVISAVAIRYDQLELFSRTIDALYEIFKEAADLDYATPESREVHFGASWVWKEIVARIYALGALLVKYERFSWIPDLALRRVDFHNRITYLWTLFAGVMLSREKRLDTPSLCPLGISFVKENVLFSKLFRQNEDDIIAYTCQFDFLQAIHALHQGDDPYPSFGVYYNYRTVPIISQLVRDTSARKSLTDMSDQELARSIVTLDEKAATSFFRFAAWDRREWADPAISEFLDKHLPSTQG